MKPFEITTPALRDAVGACRDVLTGLVEGAEAKNRIGAANATIAAVGQEIKVRIAMPRIAAAEARLVESSAHDALADSRRLDIAGGTP